MRVVMITGSVENDADGSEDRGWFGRTRGWAFDKDVRTYGPEVLFDPFLYTFAMPSNENTDTNNSGLSNESNNNRSNRRLVLPTSMVRLIRMYFRPPEAIPAILREADRDYHHYILWGRRDYDGIFLLADFRYVVSKVLRFWISMRSDVTAALHFITEADQILEQEFRLLDEVSQRFVQLFRRNRFPHQDGAALVVFAKHVLPRMTFTANMESIVPRMRRSGRFAHFVQVHKWFKHELTRLDRARNAAQIRLPEESPANEAYRYRVRGPPRRHAWLNRITNLPVPANKRGEAIDLVTLEPMNRGIPLKCGHIISKDTLSGMFRSSTKKRCPYCRAPITRKHLLSVASMKPTERPPAPESPNRGRNRSG